MPNALDLPGPSRRIRVEPLAPPGDPQRAPAPDVEPARTAEPARTPGPARTAEPAPPREPAPA